MGAFGMFIGWSFSEAHTESFFLCFWRTAIGGHRRRRHILHFTDQIGIKLRHCHSMLLGGSQEASNWWTVSSSCNTFLEFGGSNWHQIGSCVSTDLHFCTTPPVWTGKAFVSPDAVTAAIYLIDLQAVGPTSQYRQNWFSHLDVVVRLWTRIDFLLVHSLCWPSHIILVYEYPYGDLGVHHSTVSPTYGGDFYLKRSRLYFWRRMVKPRTSQSGGDSSTFT